MEELLRSLMELEDLDYKEFMLPLIPNVEPERVIGIRTPALRALARSWKDTRAMAFFLNQLPHRYYEENNLHAFAICAMKDPVKCLEAIREFLPYVDNWATCDSLRPKCFRNHKDLLLDAIPAWLDSHHPYTVRFALEMLMVHFLDGDFDGRYLRMAADVQSDEYYVNMMVAWYFATALAKQWETAAPYLEQRKLSPWIHRKTVQKARESYRITAHQKEMLKKWKYG